MKSKGVPSTIEAQWYLIRDLYFGFNYKEQDIPRALLLAAEIADQHAEAKWLVEHVPITKVDDTCPMSLCFSLPTTYAKCYIAAKVFGYTFAQSRCYTGLNIYQLEQVEFEMIHMAALKGERDAFYALGICYCCGVKCEQNAKLGVSWWLKGAQLGHVDCMVQYAKRFTLLSPVRWKWACKAAVLGNSNEFFAYFQCIVSDDLYPDIVYCIGQSLKNNYDPLNKTIFNREKNWVANRVPDVEKAISFYDMQIEKTKEAMLAFTLCCLRFRGVYKDVRVLICKYIWRTRKEGNYLELLKLKD